LAAVKNSATREPILPRSPTADFCTVFRAGGAVLRRDGNPHTLDRGIKPLLQEGFDGSIPRQLAVQKSAVSLASQERFVLALWSHFANLFGPPL